MLLTEALEKSDFETFEDLQSWYHQTTETEKQILVKTQNTLQSMYSSLIIFHTYTMKTGFRWKYTNTL